MTATDESKIETALVPEWGSDAVAAFLRAADIPFVALNPGASFRGLHDSLVNFLGNERPELLLCLHEEHAVALAHGYAKVTGRPMAVIVHSNVGLMHASMAIYDAWCDRAPVLILGATGPVDAARRRPWIEWIHTSADQGALIRPFVKWDDQPASIAAALESLARAWQLARTVPPGPTYVCLDVSLQESRIGDLEAARQPDLARRQPPPVADPPDDALAEAARVLRAASRPVILAGRVSRDPADWQHRVDLAERLEARVITDLKAGAAFPTEHPLHVPGPGFFLSDDAKRILAEADCVLSLDWIDLAGTLAQATRGDTPATVILASVDHVLHGGWSKDHFGLPPVDINLATTPDRAVARLLDRLSAKPVGLPRPVVDQPGSLGSRPTDGTLTLNDLSRHLRAATEGDSVCLIRLPLGWSGDAWPFRHPLDFLGYDGGAGIGSGPGMAVGAALALRGGDRLPVAVLGDGDYLMGVQALWTAVRHRIPLLVVVANNRSYFNDELHQERVASTRGRDVRNRWIGQRIADPAPDLAAMARAQGLSGWGPITTEADLDQAFRAAVDAVRSGNCAVVDVVVDTGYDATMAAGVVGSVE
jgi:thiamine pyrophosphate-dependent acetolactate synthase large subunit-like protein